MQVTLKQIKEKAEQLTEVREYIRGMEAEIEAKMTPKKMEKDQLQAELIAMLNEVELKSIKSKAGETFTVSSRKSLSIDDADKAYEFAKENNLLTIDKTKLKKSVDLNDLPEGMSQKETFFMSVRGIKKEE